MKKQELIDIIKEEVEAVLGEKRKKRKMNTHKRKKRLRANRHKKK